MRLITVLTLLFGAVVATSWLPFGRRAFGGAPEAVLADAWPLVYGPLVLLTAGIGFGYARRRRPTWRRAAGVVIGAWLGELVVLSLAGGLLANEIGPAERLVLLASCDQRPAAAVGGACGSHPG